MAGHARNRLVAAHVEAVAGRLDADTEVLVAAMLSFCWPGGTSDRRDPAAFEWVRRWRPRRIDAVPPQCSCAEGRCRVCN